jgi:IS1 family transposase
VNGLPLTKQLQILQLLCEGNSMRATSRIADVSMDAVVRLFINIGKVCAEYHDRQVRNIHANRVECDEEWAFCYSKQKNVSPEHQGILGYGDVWTWIAIDTDTKLTISWLVGHRTSEYANTFMSDLASRVLDRIQITTDGFLAYMNAIEKAFGNIVDYAMLIKNYDGKAHYIGSEKRVICGTPKLTDVSTSYIERMNLTIRMHNRRLTRKTNAFSKKLENFIYSIALTIMYYNFVRIHSSLRVTPAMEAGIADHCWSFEELVSLIPAPISRKRGPYRSRVKI